ncbi:cytochrome P450 [Streptomyces kanamyceticus]|uniref:Cytochrome P450 n=1 Tax=Streptomyces kanamyceticus TaxID=1967 RepID=A0A5J6G504_STRKN|nr:cytochrome P450 [Streptomyces kanamyceticus]QEU89997.1 cytochrome P450 [Streptomyces kanamyceticus]
MPKPSQIPLHEQRDGMDPVPELALMSRDTPLVEFDVPGTSERTWLAVGNDVVRAVLGDADRFSSLPPADTDTDSRRLVQPGNLLQYDPPDHTRLRKMQTPEFTGRRMRRLEPMIEEIVADHLDALERAGQPADLIRHFAAPIPSLVGCLLFDIPRDDHAELARNLDISRTDVHSRERRMAAGKAYMAYMGKFIKRKRRRPGDDLISALIKEYGTELTDDELAGTVATLLAPSVLNVGGTLGLSILALLRHPDQLARFRERPELTENAVEELTRYTSVTAASPRTALEDVTLAGQLIKAGDVVICSLFAANRARCPGAPTDDLDLTREDTSHVAYGHGIHHCLGAPLARLTLRIALPALLHRFPALRLAVPPEELRYKAPTGIYGVETLPVAW